MDKIIEGMLRKHPLSAFSVYTDGQVETLRALSGEISSVLDSSITSGSVDGLGFNRAYGLFWLWVLGAYEVVRTMCQAQSCFSAKLAADLLKFKRRLTQVRIPFAKQEYAGGRGNSKRPIVNEASVYSVDTDKRDLKFEVKGSVLSVRDLIDEFESIFDNIKCSDIIHDHRDTYNQKLP